MEKETKETEDYTKYAPKSAGTAAARPDNDTDTARQTDDTTAPAAATPPKEHSAPGSVAFTWRLFAREWRTMTRLALRSCLLAGTGLAAAAYIINSVAQRTVVPAYFYLLSGEESAVVSEVCMPTWSEALLLVLALAALLAGYCTWKATAYAQIRFFRATGSLPLAGRDTLSHDARRTMPRLAGLELVAGAVTLTLTGTTAWLCGHSLWWAAPGTLLLAGWWLWTLTARLSLMLRGTSLPQAFISGTRHAGRRLGAYVIVVLLTAVPVLWMGLVVALPLSILNLASAYTTGGLLMGDAPSMPWHTGLLYLLTGVVGGTAYYLVRTLQIWALSLCFPTDD